MINIKSVVLGYFLCFLINGCDVGITSSSDNFEVTNSGLGSNQWNPVYVKIVD